MENPVIKLVVLDTYHKALVKVPELKAKADEASLLRKQLYSSLSFKLKLWYHFIYLTLPYFRIKEYIKRKVNVLKTKV